MSTTTENNRIWVDGYTRTIPGHYTKNGEWIEEEVKNVHGAWKEQEARPEWGTKLIAGDYETFIPGETPEEVRSKFEDGTYFFRGLNKKGQTVVSNIFDYTLEEVK